MVNNETMDFINSKRVATATYEDLESMKYIRQAMGSSEDLFFQFQYLGLSESDSKEAVKFTSAVLPLPPYPEEMKDAPV